MASFNLSTVNVLVVDDMTFSRHMVTGLLTEFGAKKILEAENGQVALEILSDEAGQAMLVLSDFNMPVMHGLELLKAIRAGARNIDRSTPFAMLTGHSEKYLVEMALALDVNAFLIKPVSKKGLEQRLGKMLRHGDTDQWLKPATDYEAVDVKSALDSIPIAQPGQDAPVSRGIVVLSANQPLFRTAQSLMARGNLKGRPCSIKDIPAKAMITRDVHTSNGQLLITAG